MLPGVYNTPTKQPLPKPARKPKPDNLKWLCVGQVVCGLLLALASYVGLEGSDAAWGVLLGLMTIAVGISGLLGAVTRTLDLLNLSFAGGLLVLALIVGFSGRVYKQTAVDCALAELLAMDDSAKSKLEHSESWKGSAMGTIQMRLDALDSTLDLLENRGDLVHPSRVVDREAAASELRHEHQRALWAASDSQLVATKLSKAKQHGMQVMEQLLKHGMDPNGKIRSLEKLAAEHLPDGDVADLQQRFNDLFANTERLVRRIREHEEGEGVPVGPEEYPELLRSLEESMNSMAAFLRRLEVAVGNEGMPLTHTEFVKLMHGMDLDAELNGAKGATTTTTPLGRLPLKGLQEDAAQVSDALGRHSHTDDGYSAVRNIGADTLKMSWRLQWEEQLANQLPIGGSSDALARLPKRCVEESSGAWILTAIVLAVVIIQAAVWHSMLGIAGTMPGSARVLMFD